MATHCSPEDPDTLVLNNRPTATRRRRAAFAGIAPPRLSLPTLLMAAPKPETPLVGAGSLGLMSGTTSGGLR